MNTILPSAIDCNCESTQTDNWFDYFISTLKSDQWQFSAGIASKEKQEMYKPLVQNDYRTMAIRSRDNSSNLLAQELVLAFLNELSQTKRKPNKLAMQVSRSGILVWATINDNDEETENAIYIAEAKVNAVYYQYGFHVSATILEESDNYPIPEQYKEVRINA
jgi:hypothetical protein